jgi:hypothetical protein
MTQLAPDSEPSSSSPSAGTEIKARPAEPMTREIFWGSVFALLIGSGMAFTNDVDTVPKLLAFITLLSLGMGGILSLFRDMATLTIGKFFKATGVIAVVLVVFLILLKTVGLLPGLKLPSISSGTPRNGLADWTQGSRLVFAQHLLPSTI